MKNFKSFMNNFKEQKLLPNSSQSDSNLKDDNLQLSITNSLSKLPSLSKNEVSDFAEKMELLVTSDDFLEKVSNELGVPLENESEDEFVKRGLSLIKKNIGITSEKNSLNWSLSKSPAVMAARVATKLIFPF
jgi:hypothetical protein